MMPETLLRIFEVILALSILIIGHEAGHFLMAKLFGVRVEKFYLFFDAGGFRLFSTKHSKLLGRIFPKLKESETDYGIGWLPLGGYCKISGMIDESLDTNAMGKEPENWEFRSKKPWQRLLILLGGVLMNVIIAMVVYIAILAGWGSAYLPNTDDTHIWTNELSEEMGFRDGDVILDFDGVHSEDFGMLQADLVRSKAHRANVLRGRDTIGIYVDQSMFPQILSTPGIFSLAVEFVIDSIPPTSPNAGNGFLKKGDRIVAIGGTPITYVQQSREILASMRNETTTATIIRGPSATDATDAAETLEVPVLVDSLGLIGVYAAMPPLCERQYSVPQAILPGIKMTFTAIGDYLKDLRLVATPSTGAYKSVGSFISIGQIFPGRWNTYGFLQILALLSVMLAVVNLLPIPGLDGGHSLFTLYEMITGRKPGDRFLYVAQIIGMFILVFLMLYACGNDIGKLIK